MDIRGTTGRIAAGLVTAGALATLAGAAQAGQPTPPGMSEAEYRSLQLRSEALNREHGLGAWGEVPLGMTAAEFRALMLRSEALNREHGLGTP